MIRTNTFSKGMLALVCLTISYCSFGQIMHSGEIIFKRRTNLEKRYEGVDRFGQNKNWMKKPKFDEFALYFNDSSSLFIPIPPKVGDEDREWSTMRNTTFQNLKNDQLIKVFNFYGSEIFLKDSLRKRQWIITGGHRDIAGYNTQQAMWQANDSTRIYAWFSEQIAPSVGPEDFNDLPGAVLGLAIEDGGVVYFADKVKPLDPKDANFKKKLPENKKNEYYTTKELSKFIQDRFADKGFKGRILYDFTIW